MDMIKVNNMMVAEGKGKNARLVEAVQAHHLGYALRQRRGNILSIARESPGKIVSIIVCVAGRSELLVPEAKAMSMRMFAEGVKAYSFTAHPAGMMFKRTDTFAYLGGRSFCENRGVESMTNLSFVQRAQDCFRRSSQAINVRPSTPSPRYDSSKLKS